MASQKQIAANRRNAQKSTGPRTEAGKAVSRMNALQSGIDAESDIIRGESPSALEALALEYYDRFQPATPEHRVLVDTLVSCDWLLRRLRRAEAQLWEAGFERIEDWDTETDSPLGSIFSISHQAFARLQRRIDSVDRNFHRALKELQRLENLRVSAPPRQKEAPTEPPSPEIGFVPSPSTPLPPSADPVPPLAGIPRQ